MSSCCCLVRKKFWAHQPSEVAHLRLFGRAKIAWRMSERTSPWRSSRTPRGDGRTGAIHEQDLALVLQLPEVRRGRSGERKAAPFGCEERTHSCAQRPDSLLPFLRK